MAAQLGRRLTIASLCALGLATGCDDETGVGSGTEGTHTVVITRDGFEPRELEIEVGDRVRFHNRAGTTHSARDNPLHDQIDASPAEGPTAHDGSEVGRAVRKGFATHALFPEEWQEIVFPLARTYRYRSNFDTSMRGVVVVRAAE